jgi:iron complex transport system substrate-binding protein
MKKRRAARHTRALMCACLALSACDGASSTAPKDKESATAQGASRTSAIEASDEKAKAPVKLVTLGGVVTEIVVELGHEKEIVGVDASSIYPASLETLPKVGYYRKINAEGVLSLEPTRVLATQGLGPEAAVKQLEASGVELVMIPEADTPELALARVETIGKLIGEEERAAKLLADMKASLERAEARKKSAPETKECALFIYARGANVLMVSGTKTSADAMLSLAGFPNCVDGFEGFKPLTAEAIVAAKPTHIILPDKGAASIGGVDGVLELPGVAQTPAGTEKRVVLVDDLALLGFGPRMGEALEALQDGLGIPKVAQ